MAIAGIRHNEEFQAFYQQKLAHCEIKTKAPVTLGEKILRMLYGMVKSNHGYKPLAHWEKEYNRSDGIRYSAMRSDSRHIEKDFDQRATSAPTLNPNSKEEHPETKN